MEFLTHVASIMLLLISGLFSAQVSIPPVADEEKEPAIVKSLVEESVNLSDAEGNTHSNPIVLLKGSTVEMKMRIGERQFIQWADPKKTYSMNCFPIQFQDCIFGIMITSIEGGNVTFNLTNSKGKKRLTPMKTSDGSDEFTLGFIPTCRGNPAVDMRVIATNNNQATVLFLGSWQSTEKCDE